MNADPNIEIRDTYIQSNMRLIVQFKTQKRTWGNNKMQISFGLHLMKITLQNLFTSYFKEAVFILIRSATLICRNVETGKKMPVVLNAKYFT